MKHSLLKEPVEALEEAYETMHDRVLESLREVKEHTGPTIHKFIDQARDKAVELDELTEEDAEKLTLWLKRDLDDAIEHIAETDEQLMDWLGFEVAHIESALLYMLLQTADKTTVELMRLKQSGQLPYSYLTGEVTGPGTLRCDACGETIQFQKPATIPLCPNCQSSSFSRERR